MQKKFILAKVLDLIKIKWNSIVIRKKINRFKKTITVPGDKSLSIRWVLFASLATGKSTAKNLLISEDVLAAIEAVRKLVLK